MIPDEYQELAKKIIGKKIKTLKFIHDHNDYSLSEIILEDDLSIHLGASDYDNIVFAYLENENGLNTLKHDDIIYAEIVLKDGSVVHLGNT
jgi:hypothetical protein